MIHFNRKTEYALLAIEHMIRKENQSAPVISTREIAETYRIPYNLLAKVLQKLAVKGLIKSVQGTKGGYVLARRPIDITVADIVEIFDGPFAVAECFNGEKITCPQWDGCLIKSPFYELNHKIYDLLAQTTVADLAQKNSTPPLTEELT
jgi:Rrf2 family protein